MTVAGQARTGYRSFYVYSALFVHPCVSQWTLTVPAIVNVAIADIVESTVMRFHSSVPTPKTPMGRGWSPQ